MPDAGREATGCHECQHPPEKHERLSDGRRGMCGARLCGCAEYEAPMTEAALASGRETARCLHGQHEVRDDGIRRGWAGTGWEACPPRCVVCLSTQHASDAHLANLDAGREATHAKVCRWIKGQQVEYDTQACIRCRQMESPPARGAA